jgi:hypothetical protein
MGYGGIIGEIGVYFQKNVAQVTISSGMK